MPSEDSSDADLTHMNVAFREEANYIYEAVMEMKRQNEDNKEIKRYN